MRKNKRMEELSVYIIAIEENCHNLSLEFQGT